MEEKFSIVKRGYDPGEVNRYIEDIEAALISYKEKDASIKNAIVSAQVAADSIINKAEFEADSILKNADEKSTDKIAAVEKYINDMLEIIEGYKYRIASFRREYNSLVEKYTEQFDEDEFERLISEADEMKTHLAGARNALFDPQE